MSFNNNAAFIGFGFALPLGPATHSFMVFQPGIPPGANILGATLSIKSDGDYASIPSTRLYGVRQGAPAIPASAADCQNAPLTINFRDKVFATPADDWTTDFWYVVYNDIIDVIQEIVNLPGYTIASLVILQLRWLGASPLGRTWYSWDSDPDDAPILCVDYSFGREVYFKGMVRGKFRKMR